jgi:hypothetical protein
MYDVQIIPPGTLEFLKEREREREEKAASAPPSRVPTAPNNYS